MTTYEILGNVKYMIELSEAYKEKYKRPARWKIIEFCVELGIFDWWNDSLSLSQLRQMERFLQTAIDLGFGGYACFKVGAKYCSNGMWAYSENSTDGFAPSTGECLFHSFVSGENYWDALTADGTWLHEREENEGRFRFSLKEVKAALA